MLKLSVAVVLLATAAPALAQEEPSSFDGFRLEGLVGYDSLRSGGISNDGANTSADDGDETLDGAVFGVAAGYDFDFGGVVAGIEAEFSESTGKQQQDETLDLPISSKIETGRDLYVGARVGYSVANTLAYLKAGYTNTSIEASFEDDTNAVELDTNVDGWRAGAGVEFKVSANTYAKLEYRYSNYDKLDFSLDDDIQTDIDLDRHQVVAGFGFRF